jgi:hypothetical protein
MNDSAGDIVFDDGMTAVDYSLSIEAPLYKHLRPPFDYTHGGQRSLSPTIEWCGGARALSGARPVTPKREEWSHVRVCTCLALIQIQSNTLVPITLTLTEEGAKNIQRVMDRLAALLNLTQPVKFDVHMHTPPQTPDKSGAQHDYAHVYPHVHTFQPIIRSRRSRVGCARS